MNILFLACLLIQGTGIIITDNVLFYEGDLEMRVFFAGDTVTIEKYSGDTARVCFNGVSGTLLKGVFVDSEEKIAQDQLFMFARGYYEERCFPQALRLFMHFLYFFPESRYVPEALFFTGCTFDELARSGTDYDTLPGIFQNDKTGRYYYAGTVYMHVLERFPLSRYAARAAYRMILCSRSERTPWGKAVEKIEEDLRQLQVLVDSYGEFEERASALLEIGYDHRALFELTNDESHRKSATLVFESVIRDYPETVYEAGARVHLYELENEIPIYVY